MSGPPLLRTTIKKYVMILIIVATEVLCMMKHALHQDPAHIDGDASQCHSSIAVSTMDPTYHTGLFSL